MRREYPQLITLEPAEDDEEVSRQNLHPVVATTRGLGHGDQVAVNDIKDRVRQRLTDMPEDDPSLSDLKKIGTALGIER